MARIFHIATTADWEEAQQSGGYTTSTRGRSLADEGFIHASRDDQWSGVRERFYADVTEPLVLLVIDTDLLDVPVVEEPAVAGETGAETFPHLYGPLSPAAVVQVVPLEEALAGSVRSFSSIFLSEMFGNALLGVLLILCVVGGVAGGRVLDRGTGPWLGLVVGLIAGIAAVLTRNRLRR